jgi:sulfite exporter TauE/SafE
MSETYLAFMIGLLGSVHCIGMCGPLAFAVPSLQKGAGWLVFDKSMYQAGRIISYCVLGLIIGLIGNQLWMAGMQQGLSIMSGCLILLAALSRILKLAASKGTKYNLLLKPFNKLFGYALKHKANHLIIGMINGLLPCGFVYLALAGAVNQATVPDAVAYMFFFGLGTAPLMLIAAVTTGLTGAIVRNRINEVIPYMMLCLGIWFILRGLDLNIPYLSPAPHTGTAVCK